MGLTRPRFRQIRETDFKNSCRVVTTTNVELTNGAPTTVDGVNLQFNDRVLVTGQTVTSQNGIYVVSVLGSGENGTWTRSNDAKESLDVTSGLLVAVTEGTVNGNTSWTLTTDDPITLGTTGLSFQKTNTESAGGSSGSNYTDANVATYLESYTGDLSAGNITVSGTIDGYATTSYVDTEISNLVNAAPAALDTLNELAAALNNDADFSTTVTSLIGNNSSNIAVLQSDVTALQGNVATVESDITAIESNISTLQGNVATVESDVTTLQNDVANLNYYDNSNVTTFLSDIGSNAISTTGNVTAGYFIGNGSQLTGITGGSGGGNVTVANTAPVSPSSGDIWIDSDSGIRYLYFNDGDSNQWAEMEAATSISFGSDIDLSAVSQDITPSANATYSLGNATNRWANLYLVGNTIDLGGAQIKADAGTGAFAFVPAPTDAQPNPVATVISATGGVVTVETAGGEIDSNVISEAASTSSDAVYIFPTQINSNVTVAANTNGLSVGPISQAANTVITINAGQRWIIL